MLDTEFAFFYHFFQSMQVRCFALFLLKRNSGMDYHGIDISEKQLGQFCIKWKVKELSLFGSVLRDDFSPDSDIDVLVSFMTDAPWTLWDLMEMKEELESLFSRPVDLVEKEALRNPWRKREILSTYEVLYAA
jgi:predicted nucleotidyltransferase